MTAVAVVVCFSTGEVYHIFVCCECYIGVESHCYVKVFSVHSRFFMCADIAAFGADSKCM
jgi:hypothetical protein